MKLSDWKIDIIIKRTKKLNRIIKDNKGGKICYHQKEIIKDRPIIVRRRIEVILLRKIHLHLLKIKCDKLYRVNRKRRIEKDQLKIDQIQLINLSNHLNNPYFQVSRALILRIVSSINNNNNNNNNNIINN